MNFTLLSAFLGFRVGGWSNGHVPTFWLLLQFDIRYYDKIYHNRSITSPRCLESSCEGTFVCWPRSEVAQQRIESKKLKPAGSLFLRLLLFGSSVVTCPVIVVNDARPSTLPVWCVRCYAGPKKIL